MLQKFWLSRFKTCPKMWQSKNFLPYHMTRHDVIEFADFSGLSTFLFVKHSSVSHRSLIVLEWPTFLDRFMAVFSWIIHGTFMHAIMQSFSDDERRDKNYLSFLNTFFFSFKRFKKTIYSSLQLATFWIFSVKCSRR